eukprot:TRINITY_DN773212_c0_g1_i1.p1 TRINITY_DN773212_c0_g1~~TRINITY_DN773212_c0_g1_i1.p1  ORF type:complete len:213 (-),score=65.62 TRINITY_DN773212_c0_g1_i1:244-882(-)
MQTPRDSAYDRKRQEWLMRKSQSGRRPASLLHVSHSSPKHEQVKRGPQALSPLAKKRVSKRIELYEAKKRAFFERLDREKGQNGFARPPLPPSRIQQQPAQTQQHQQQHYEVQPHSRNGTPYQHQQEQHSYSNNNMPSQRSHSSIGEEFNHAMNISSRRESNAQYQQQSGRSQQYHNHHQQHQYDHDRQSIQSRGSHYSRGSFASSARNILG